MKNINEYKAIQRCAKEVLDEIRHFIVTGISEKDIAAECVSLLREKGITQCWYHGVPALVLCGSRSKVSVSGRDYIVSEEMVSHTDLVTIDLSPSKGNIWGRPGTLARIYILSVVLHRPVQVDDQNHSEQPVPYNESTNLP